MDLAASASDDRGLVRPADCIDTFRLFIDNLNFFYEDSDGWIFLNELINRRASIVRGINAHADDNERNALALWPLQFLAPDIKNNFVEEHVNFLLKMTVGFHSMDIFNLLFKIFDNSIDVKTQADEYSILLKEIWYVYEPRRDRDILPMILTRGADPHLIGFDDYRFSPQKETPTSLAMYSSWAFVNWRYALLQNSTDLEIFVQKELQQSPLKDAGWHENSLLSLFQSHIHPQVDPASYPSCEMCGESITSLVELSWWRWLESIKEVCNPDYYFHIECKAKYVIES